MKEIIMTKWKGARLNSIDLQGRWPAVAWLNLVLAVSTSSGGRPTGPTGGPFSGSLQAVSGNNQMGVSGEALAEPFWVRVSNATGVER